MKRSLRSRLQTDERRALLLEMGVALFSQRPYSAVSIDEIAQAADISRGLLYHYFGGKRSFYLACIEVDGHHLVDVLSPDPTLPAPDRIVIGLSTYLDWISARTGGYLAVMRGGVDGEVSVILERARVAIVSRITADMALSEAAAPTFALAVRAWLGAVETASATWLAEKSVPRASLVAILYANLIGSLAAAAQLEPDSGFVLEASARAWLQTAGH